MSNEYWLVAAPAEPSAQSAKQSLERAVRDHAEVRTFEVPQQFLKVGTLDTLVSLSDDLGKLDSFAEGVANKLHANMADILNKDAARLKEAMLVGDVSYDSFITRFQWNTAKYNVNLSLKELTDELSQRVSHIEGELKSKMQQYNKLKTVLQAHQRKEGGSLLIRNLTGLVNEKHFVNSETLITLLVVVPQAAIHEWQTSYETLVEHYIVPRSSEKIAEDNEYYLVNVTMFRKVVDDFKTRARERKFVVRDFEYNPEEIQADEAEHEELKAEAQKKFNQLLTWCKVQFSECFEASFHIKALRVFIESVLRFGLPVNFYAAVLKPYRSTASRPLRQALQQLYSHLDGGRNDSAADFDIAGMGSVLGSQEYYPYVYFNTNLSHWSL